MVDYNELRKKFPAKNPARKKKQAAIKAIAREYERKKAEQEGVHAPVMKKGIVFYAVVVIGLLMLGGLVLSATGRGGRATISKAQLQAQKSVDALATALGRYRYHVGTYPAADEGLEQLASTKVRKRGWDGPYIRKVVKDPWGHDYVYVYNGEAENPTLYSKGADGLAGTSDDVLPAAGLFEAAFTDPSWTKGWMPYTLRGYVVAPDAETKAMVEGQVQSIIAAEEVQAEAAARRANEKVAVAFLSVEPEVASVELRFFDADGNETDVQTRNYRWARPYKFSTDKAFMVKVEPETKSLGDGEVGFAHARLVDFDWLPLADAAGEVVFSLEGPGEILAVHGSLASGAAVVAFRRRFGSGQPLKLTGACAGVRSDTVTIPRN